LVVYSVCEHGTHTHEVRCNSCTHVVHVEGEGGVLIERTRPNPQPLRVRRPGVWTF
jgi:hypothetical protein